MLVEKNFQLFLDGETDIMFTEFPERCEQTDKFIDELDKSYRLGNQLIPDEKFDKIVEFYGYKPIYYQNQHQFSRKTKVPVNIGSMEKLKNISELHKWLDDTDAKDNDIFVISSKYDGVAVISNESNNKLSAWTSGKDGTGLDISKHYELFKNNFGSTIKPNWYVKGELIMDIQTFDTKYFKKSNLVGFENARNMISGKVADLEPSSSLLDAYYMCYSIMDNNNIEPLDKIEQFELLNQCNRKPIYYIKTTAFELRNMDDNFFISMFKEQMLGNFELDGFIIEYNSKEKRSELGYETNSFNPKYARAFKHEEFEQKAETTIKEIKRQISKSGIAVPVAAIEPVRLNGATISNVYLDNERFLAEFGIGIGTKVVVKRSGMVIPRITQVEHVKVPSNKSERNSHEKIRLSFGRFVLHNSYGNKPYDDNSLCNKINELVRSHIGLSDISKYVSFDTDIYKWDQNCVDCILIKNNDTVIKQKLVAFFEIIGAFGISDGIIDQLYNNGYNDLKTILTLNPSDFRILQGWDEKKANNIYQSIKQSITAVPLEIVQHASGLFGGLGSKKLILLKHFKNKPTIDQVKQIEGFSDITAKIYVDNFDNFWQWLADLPISLALSNSIERKSNNLDGKSFVFTGFRSLELENQIQEHGGEIKSSISSKVTYLVMKQIGSGSTKEKKAKELNIGLLDETMLKSMLQIDMENGSLF